MWSKFVVVLINDKIASCHQDDISNYICEVNKIKSVFQMSIRTTVFVSIEII